jgi:hypothetical protein
MQSLDLVLGQLDRDRGDRVVDVSGARRSDDRRADTGPAQQPGESGLGGARSALAGDRPHDVGDSEIGRPILALVLL